MLWPKESPVTSWLAQLLNKGYDATKAVDSSIKAIISLEGSNENSKFRCVF